MKPRQNSSRRFITFITSGTILTGPLAGTKRKKRKAIFFFGNNVYAYLAITE